MAEEMGLNYKAVKSCVFNICRKEGVRGRKLLLEKMRQAPVEAQLGRQEELAVSEIVKGQP
jgi:hypothetical protein